MKTSLITSALALALLLFACDLSPQQETTQGDLASEIPSFREGTEVSVPSGDASVSQSGVVGKNATASVPVADGWNLVSVPLESTSTFGEDFPMCSSAFVFDTGQGYDSIEESEVLPAGRGAFLNCSQGTATIDGSSPSSSIELGEGWNLIGALNQTVATSNLTSTPSGILESSFFAYDPSGGYTAADSLRTGNGYWVKASTSGTLEFPVVADSATVTFTRRMIGKDLFDPPVVDSLTVVGTDTTTKAFSGGSVSFTVAYSTDDSIRVVNESEDALDTFVLYDTEDEPAPDLTQPTGEFEDFPREPTRQSTTESESDTPANVITLDPEALAESYEARFIPTVSPEGHSTADEYIPHVSSARRFKTRIVDGDSLTQSKTYIVEQDNDEEWNDRAGTAITEVREVLPYPTSDTIWVESSEAIVDSIQARSNYNVTGFGKGSNGNTQFYDGDYIESTRAKASGGTNLGTTISEFYSAMTDMNEAGSEDINDTIFDSNGDFLPTEAAFPIRIEYHTVSNSPVE